MFGSPNTDWFSRYNRETGCLIMDGYQAQVSETSGVASTKARSEMNSWVGSSQLFHSRPNYTLHLPWGHNWDLQQDTTCKFPMGGFCLEELERLDSDQDCGVQGGWSLLLPPPPKAAPVTSFALMKRYLHVQA